MRIEIGNMSKRQQSEQRADNKKYTPMIVWYNIYAWYYCKTITAVVCFIQQVQIPMLAYYTLVFNLFWELL